MIKLWNFHLNILPRLRQLPVRGELEWELRSEIILSIVINATSVDDDDDDRSNDDNIEADYDDDDEVEADYDDDDNVEADFDDDDDDDNLSKRPKLTLYKNPPRGSEKRSGQVPKKDIGQRTSS